MSSSSIHQKDDIQHHEAIDMSTQSKYGDDAIAEKAAQMHMHTTHTLLTRIQPAPIGFGAFALCSFILGLYNTGYVVRLPQIAVGVALGYGAMGQFVCGLTELFLGNTFAATSMLTFSGFFFTFGIMLIPSSGIFTFIMENGGIVAFEETLGLIQVAYAIASFLFLLGTFRQPILIRLVLLQVFLTFLCGGVGGLTGINNFVLAGGWISFTLSLTAWYVMAALIYTPDHTFIKFPFF
jgi:succinate-acetate transporter protein